MHNTSVVVRHAVVIAHMITEIKIINVQKTKSVLFSRNVNAGIELSIGNEKIEKVKCFKFLGYNIDSNLSFAHHSHHLYNALKNSVFLIGKLSTFIPHYCLRTLYYAHYFSRLNYGINIWFPLLRIEDKTRLVNLQKRVLRIICRRGP